MAKVGFEPKQPVPTTYILTAVLCDLLGNCKEEQYLRKGRKCHGNPMWCGLLPLPPTTPLNSTSLGVVGALGGPGTGLEWGGTGWRPQLKLPAFCHRAGDRVWGFGGPDGEWKSPNGSTAHGPEHPGAKRSSCRNGDPSFVGDFAF